MEPEFSETTGEIEFKAFIRDLVGRRYWIGGLAALGAIVALLVSIALPNQYESSAIVVVTRPDISFQFDPRIQTQVDLPELEGLAEIALSDEILKAVAARAQGISGEATTAEDMSRAVDVSLSGALMKLTIREADPGHAAELANFWAAETVARVQEVYNPSMAEAERFRAQANRALDAWQLAQATLVQFQSGNSEIILKNRLAALELKLANILVTQQYLEAVLQDAVSTRSRLETAVGDADLRDDLVTVMLAMRALRSSSYSIGTTSSALGSVANPGLGPNIDLLLSSESGLLSDTSTEQVDYLDSLIDLVREDLAMGELALEGLEQEITNLQGQLAETLEERTRLEKLRDLDGEAHEALARKASELETATDEQGIVSRIAARAVESTEPVAPRTAFNVVLGVLLGLSSGVLLVTLQPHLVGDPLAARST